MGLSVSTAWLGHCSVELVWDFQGCWALLGWVEPLSRNSWPIFGNLTESFFFSREKHNPDSAGCNSLAFGVKTLVLGHCDSALFSVTFWASCLVLPSFPIGLQTRCWCCQLSWW